MVEVCSSVASSAATFEHRAILDLCVRPLSIAELAAHLSVPVGVVSVLVDDLVSEGALAVHTAEPIDLEISALQRMIEKVRAL